MVEKIEDTISVWQDIAEGIQTVLNPLRDAIRVFTVTFNTTTEKIKNVGVDCRTAISKAQEDCSSKINGAYKNCLNKVPSLFNKVKVCKLVDIGGVCKIIDTGYCSTLDFGASLFDGLNKLFSLLQQFTEMYDLKVNVGQGIHQNFTSSTNLTEIRDRIREEFYEKFSKIQFILNCIQYVLIGTIFLIPYKSFCYLRQRLKNQKLGNGAGMLKKNANTNGKNSEEKQKPQKTKKPKLSKEQRREKQETKLQIVLLFTHFLLSGTIIAFDQTLYWITSTVKQHGNATFEASGEINVNLQVEGGAILKPIMQTFLDSFNIERNYSFVTSTTDCLPNPIEPSRLSLFIPIGIIYFCALILIVVGNKVLWIRTRIFRYFYPIIPAF